MRALFGLLNRLFMSEISDRPYKAGGFIRVCKAFGKFGSAL